MARNRMLNPEFWLDEEVAKLSAHARLLYMGLWGICDDNYATLPNKAGWIKAQVFPYEDVNVVKLLQELENANKIIRFRYEDNEYWHIKNFFKHQRVEKPSKPKYPEFEPQNQVLPDYSPNTPAEEKRREVKISEDKREDAPAELTPSQKAKNFFLKVKTAEKEYLEFITSLSAKTKIPFEPLSREVKKFTDYWTERDFLGKKERWQKQETFEVDKRLNKWLQNAAKYSGASAPRGKQII